jgi:hypothetical protein
MKLRLMTFISVAASLIPAAQASIVCQGKTTFGSSLRLVLNPDSSAQLAVYDENGVVVNESFPHTDEAYDGHMTGLITAPGLSVKYENQYGCIRHVVVTANIRGEIGLIQTVMIPVCRGGSVSDQVCHAH